MSAENIRDPYLVDPTVWLVFGVAVAALVASPLWDAGTTLSTNKPPVAFAGAFSGAACAIPWLYFWFRRRGDLHDIPAWHLKHDSPGLWVVSGVFTAMVFIGCAFWLSWVVLSVAVQYAPGEIRDTPVLVSEAVTHSGRRVRCRQSAKVRAEWQEAAELCFKQRILDSALVNYLSMEVPATMRTKHSVLGVSVVSIVAVPAAPNASLERSRDR